MGDPIDDLAEANAIMKTVHLKIARLGKLADMMARLEVEFNRTKKEEAKAALEFKKAKQEGDDEKKKLHFAQYEEIYDDAEEILSDLEKAKAESDNLRSQVNGLSIHVYDLCNPHVGGMLLELTRCKNNLLRVQAELSKLSDELEADVDEEAAKKAATNATKSISPGKSKSPKMKAISDSLKKKVGKLGQKSSNTYRKDLQVLDKEEAELKARITEIEGAFTKAHQQLSILSKRAAKLGRDYFK